MRKILKHLYIIQEVSNRGRNPKLGRGFFNAYRLNPYNPLSYLLIPLVFVVGITAFGIIGFWKQIDFTNPFKWN